MKKKKNAEPADKTYGFRPQSGALDVLRVIAKNERRTVNWLINEAIGEFLGKHGIRLSTIKTNDLRGIQK